MSVTTPLPAAVSAALNRFAQTLARDIPADRVLGQAALTDLLAAVALHPRPVRWFDDASAACVHLATQTLARISAELQPADEAEEPTQDVFAAAEAAFDAGWANGWPELHADCEIAAGRRGLLDRMQASHRLWAEAMSASSAAAAIARALEDAEAAMAGVAFDVTPDSLETWSEPSDGADELRDIACDRVRRHRTDVSGLVEGAIMCLAVADAPECARAKALAAGSLDAWAAGVRLFWVCPNEIVAVARGEPSDPGPVSGKHTG